ncbi:hypothetical protein GGX14DRAFT_397551 [Mycena pura]|uniref:Uncharacterized protein n=1 Tax=Mycena pura TaxID=153505 RepID=A0AAD6V7R9_9AGAR|nr:hypothetical protein GGX14DRAFT_397551 [Mycena pura]
MPISHSIWRDAERMRKRKRKLERQRQRQREREQREREQREREQWLWGDRERQREWELQRERERERQRQLELEREQRERERERRERERQLVRLRRAQLTQRLQAPQAEGRLLTLLSSFSEHSVFIMLAILALELVGWFIFLGLLVTVLAYLLLIISFGPTPNIDTPGSTQEILHCATTLKSNVHRLFFDNIRVGATDLVTLVISVHILNLIYFIVIEAN